MIVLLQLLDYEFNDIYIHVDKKAKQFPVQMIKKSVKKSKLFFIKRINVNWGAYSLIRAEIALLKAATKRTYVYYHLVSGSCLPLHSQSYIHYFFKNNNGSEFLRAENISDENNKYLNYRLKTYHFFQEFLGKDKRNSMLERIDRKLQKLQKKIHINRIKRNIQYYYGDNWFSITHKLAKYVINHEKSLRKHMKHSICADEIFMQTLVMSSPYAENVVGHCGRYIDWHRGQPYVFRKEDYCELINTDRLFARKFNINIDKEIIDMIVTYISGLAETE